MPHYMIESPHTYAECHMALENFLATGYLTHFDWGCDDDCHCGWMVMEAASKEEAMMVVPSVLRGSARIVEVVKFGPEDFARERKAHSRKSGD